MCGRYTIGAPAEEAVRQFALDRDAKEVWDSLTPRYNVAPTQTVPVVKLSPSEAAEPARRLVPMRWGLVPSWAQDPKIGNRLINARCETVANKPAFRSAFKRRRCLVPATGFFEWKRTPRNKKHPFLLRRRGGGLLAFAGIWDSWHGDAPSGHLETFSIVTGPPNEVAAPIHDRMPVILPEPDYDIWLDPEADPNHLLELLDVYPAERMEAYPVSLVVNNPRNDSPDCIEPLGGVGR